MQLDVVFCDNHLLVVNKPAGLSTQDHGKEMSLEQLAKEWIKKTYAKKGAVFLEPIHRLDTPVSGLVLFARTSKALSRLNEQMREGKISKTYFAQVEGRLPQKQGTLEHYLVHGKHYAFVVKPDHPEGKQALLSYEVLQIKEGISFLEIVLHTGRYHQIRAQMCAMGTPVVGDKKYGSCKDAKQIALHHGRLRFLHPTTQKECLFEKKG